MIMQFIRKGRPLIPVQDAGPNVGHVFLSLRRSSVRMHTAE